MHDAARRVNLARLVILVISTADPIGELSNLYLTRVGMQMRMYVVQIDPGPGRPWEVINIVKAADNNRGGYGVFCVDQTHT